MKNDKQKKKTRKQRKNEATTRQLIGIKSITNIGVQTDFGELVYFSISPSNISVLSDENLSGRIYSLMTVLKGLTEIEILCINSRENFSANKIYLQSRIKSEKNPKVRELLEKDMSYLDHIQAQTATAREFLFITRLVGLKEKEIQPYLSRVEKILKEQGFASKQLAREEIKALLAVYYEQNVTSDSLEDYDGERWLI